VITDEWQNHLNKLTDFWASITLGDTAYSGKPVKPHMYMEGLQRETFEQCLRLFLRQQIDFILKKQLISLNPAVR